MPTVSTRVVARSTMGRFIADIEGAATRSVQEALNTGVAHARVATPTRTGLLSRSFETKILSRTSGVFTNRAAYAMYQDQGTSPHAMPGDVSFFWEREGRMWLPGENEISHPGNPATHFMDAGYDAIKRRMQEIIRRNYPG